MSCMICTRIFEKLPSLYFIEANLEINCPQRQLLKMYIAKNLNFLKRKEKKGEEGGADILTKFSFV